MSSPAEILNYMFQQMLMGAAVNSASAKCDLVLLIGNKRITVSRQVLETSSEYFRILLAANPQKKIRLQNVALEPAKIIMEYLHVSKGNYYEPRPLFKEKLAQMDPTFALEILRLTERFQLLAVKRYLVFNLIDVINLSNVVSFLEFADVNNLKKLKTACLVTIDLLADEFIAREIYLGLSHELLLEILERDSLYAPEIYLLIMCLKWWEKNKSHSLESILARVRFTQIEREDLHTLIRPLQIVPDEIISNAIKAEEAQGTVKPKRFMAIKKPYNTKFSTAIRQGVVTSMSDGFYVGHEIGKKDACILLELNNHFLVNKISLCFYDKDVQYSYYVEVSNDQKTWNRVVDYSQFMCKNAQNLFFELQPVKFIKIVGTGCNSEEKELRLRGIEPRYDRVAVDSTPTGVYDPTFARLFDITPDEIMYLDQPHLMHTFVCDFKMDVPIKLRIETSVDGKTWELGVEKTVEKADLFGSPGNYCTKFVFPPRVAICHRFMIV